MSRYSFEQGPKNSGRRVESTSIYGKEIEAVQAELKERREAFAARVWHCTCTKPRPVRKYTRGWQCLECGRLIREP